MRFDFACFALCSISIDEDLEFDIHDVTATLLSFHTTPHDAFTEAGLITEIKRAAHKVSFGAPIWNWHAPEFKEPIYQIVPIERMIFEDMQHAQEMIEQAAILQQKGVGV
jgi:hypothetical protein